MLPFARGLAKASLDAAGMTRNFMIVYGKVSKWKIKVEPLINSEDDLFG